MVILYMSFLLLIILIVLSLMFIDKFRIVCCRFYGVFTNLLKVIVYFLLSFKASLLGISGLFYVIDKALSSKGNGYQAILSSIFKPILTIKFVVSAIICVFIVEAVFSAILKNVEISDYFSYAHINKAYVLSIKKSKVYSVDVFNEVSEDFKKLVNDKLDQGEKKLKFKVSGRYKEKFTEILDEIVNERNSKFGKFDDGIINLSILPEKSNTYTITESVFRGYEYNRLIDGNPWLSIFEPLSSKYNSCMIVINVN